MVKTAINQRGNSNRFFTGRKIFSRYVQFRNDLSANGNPGILNMENEKNPVRIPFKDPFSN